VEAEVATLLGCHGGARASLYQPGWGEGNAGAPRPHGDSLRAAARGNAPMVPKEIARDGVPGGTQPHMNAS
jgi:hypothetical protein